MKFNSHIFSELVSDANEYYLDLLGYYSLKSKLRLLSKDEWALSCKTFHLNTYSQGFFLPRNQTAYIPYEIDNSSLSLFHEYFGHGLFCEKNQIGKRLVALEQLLLEDEIKFLNGKDFSAKELQDFRKSNLTFQELRREWKDNLELYENFAIWSEYNLSKEFGIQGLFEIKYDEMSKEGKEVIENIISFQQNFGNLATFYALGFERRTTTLRVKSLLKDIYGKEKLDSVKIALLYGSKKPYSDIDIFVISEDLPEIKTHWLDVNVVSPFEFEKAVSLFDVEVTDPLITGEFIAGDDKYLELKRKQLIEQPIKEEAIIYNLEASKEQEKSALYYPENSDERQIGLSYSQTYFKSASALKRGDRKLTKMALT